MCIFLLLRKEVGMKIFRGFNFGGARGGGMKFFSGDIKRNARSILLIVGTVFACYAIYTSAVIVDAKEEALVTRFGKYNRKTQAGLHFILPLGIEKAYKVAVREVQTEHFGDLSREDESTMLTGDLNIVDVQWIIQYRITDPESWLFNVRDRRETIRDISISVINTLVGDRAILDVMGRSRSDIENRALIEMNDNFSSLHLGINVIAVKMQNIIPPKGVQDAFEDVNKAIQDMNRFINEGKAMYNEEIPRANGEAKKALLMAKGYASERVNKARGDAARFNAVYNEYKSAPLITRKRMYFEAMQEVFGQENPPVIIDKRIKNFLPLKSVSEEGNTK